MGSTNDVLKRIVVGAGRGETSVHAIRDGLRLATELGGVTLHFVSVLSRPDGAHPDRLRQALLDEESCLVHAVQQVADTTPLSPARIDFVFHVRLGEVATALTQVAFDVGASLIVVGAHHASRARAILGGSVAERLLLEGRYPVLVARPIDTTGLVASPRPEPRRPGEPLHDDREALLESSDRVDFTLPIPHVSGLI